MTKKTIADWQALAEKELKRPADSLVWNTPEGIDVKPLYTEADTENLGHLGTLPGLSGAPGMVKVTIPLLSLATFCAPLSTLPCCQL